jgi:hypothetical protein
MSRTPAPEHDPHVDPGLPFRPADAAESAEAARLCSAGLIRAVVADVFVAADVPDSPTLRARAAALVLPERLTAAGGIVGFASAAWVLTGWHPDGVPASLDVMVAARVSPGPGVRVRQVGVSPEDVVTLEGLSLTSAARTAADLARDWPWSAARAGLAALVVVGMAPDDVLECLGRMRGARGVAHARAAVARWVAECAAGPAAGSVAESVPESAGGTAGGSAGG